MRGISSPISATQKNIAMHSKFRLDASSRLLVICRAGVQSDGYITRPPGTKQISGHTTVLEMGNLIARVCRGQKCKNDRQGKRLRDDTSYSSSFDDTNLQPTYVATLPQKQLHVPKPSLNVSAKATC